jgi:flagellar biosynthesis/type III secretory pathway protein FliH
MKQVVDLRQANAEFAAMIHAGKSCADAYLATIGKGRTYKSRLVPQQLGQKAARRPAVQAELARLKASVMAHFTKKAIYTAEIAMQEADEAIKLAKERGQAAAYVAAVALKAKINGLLVEDRRNERAPLADMSDEQLDQVIESVGSEIQSMTPTKPASGQIH